MTANDPTRHDTYHLTMTDPLIDSDRVERDLPDGWEAEQDGDWVRAYPPEQKERRGPGDVPAPVTIVPTSGGLWRATWMEPNEARGGLHGLPTDETEAQPERALQWLNEKAETMRREEGDDG